MASAVAQEEFQTSDSSSSSESNEHTTEHKAAEKEHHEDEENEEDNNPHLSINPVFLYLYSKILLITVLGAAAVAFLTTAAGRTIFGNSNGAQFIQF